MNFCELIPTLFKVLCLIEVLLQSNIEIWIKFKFYTIRKDNKIYIFAISSSSI